jgi:pyruvate dehydrogenase E2 component (dihydrolipoamide acetyltransferase)
VYAWEGTQQLLHVPSRLPTATQHIRFVQMNICTDALDRLYKELKPRGVTMSALISKACGVALANHPRLFASCTPDGAGMTFNSNINIANAVAMPDGGLITPVLKNADTTDIYTLSRQWADLVKRARSKQVC